jgi:EmrB/QacA subfamily drug resistance transporter
MATQNYVDNPTVQKNRWWILTAVGLFTFMATLDGSIVNIALPVISKDMHIMTNQAEWIVSIYLLTICALLLLFGKIGDNFGKIRVFRVGTVLFTIGSLLCGFNHSLIFLLAARVIQALGASMTMSTNNGIITEVFPMKERGKALGLIGSFVSLGAIAGPGIGGMLLAQLPWAYIFWINVPLGLLTIGFGHFILPKDIARANHPIDWPGAITFAVAIISLFLAIFMGQAVGFANLSVLALFAFAILVFALFAWIEQKRAVDPLLSFHLFKNLDFSMSLLTGFLIFVANFFFNVIAPFYLQNARGLMPNEAGYLLMLFPIVQVVVSPISGSLQNRFAPELLTTVGLVILSITQIGYMTATLSTPLWLFGTWVGVMGFGNGVFQSPNNTIVMSTVSQHDLGVAGGMNALARNLGMVVGISASTTVLFASMSQAYGKPTTTYIAGRPDIFLAGMHTTLTVAFFICALATLINLWRYLHRRVQAQ